MRCNELVKYINEAEAHYRKHNVQAPVLTVAAAAYASILPEDGTPFYGQCEKLFGLAGMVEAMRNGQDPRCESCINESKIEDVLNQRGANEVVQ